MGRSSRGSAWLTTEGLIQQWSGIRQRGQVVRASSLYQTAARDVFDQPDFTNAAVELETDLPPVDLLFALKRLEVTIGRDPNGVRFGPRLIDLDILSFDGQCVEDPELDLIVPHPRFHEREFVLAPLAEVAPEWRDPVTGRTVGDLLGRIQEGRA